MINTLNNNFWDLVVSIDKLSQAINCEDNLFEKRSNIISISLTAIEHLRDIDNRRSVLSENQYKYVFKGVSDSLIKIPYKIEFNTFELERGIICNKISDENLYEISFKNEDILIKFKFIEFIKTELSKKEFIDPIKTK
jgi:hypothetical protein